jgi:hypothetical protein
MAPRLRLGLFAVLALLAALSAAQPAGATPACATRLLSDWRDGRIDRVYPVECYREALANLPEDLRIYSSAESDITRALQARLESRSEPVGAGSHHGGGGVSPLLVLAISAALLVGAGSLLAITR